LEGRLPSRPHPELFEALKEMLAAFSMENIDVSASLRRTSAKASARIAIAKARGEVAADEGR